MWSAEGIANTFVGPPLGSLLLLAAFALPFFVDAASFFAAAALVASIPGTFRAERPEGRAGTVAQRAGRGLPLAVGQRSAALDGDHPRSDEPGLDAQRLGAGAVRPGDPQRSARWCSPSWASVSPPAGDRRQPRAVVVEANRQRHLPGPHARLQRGGVVRRRAVVAVASRHGDVRHRGNARRLVERDHRQPAPVDHPAAPARHGSTACTASSPGG